MNEETEVSDGHEKTLTGVFAAAYGALNAAGALAQACDGAASLDGIKDEVDALHLALAQVPQCDMDALVRNVLETYRAIVELRIMGIGFEKTNGGILAKVTLRFGENDITLAAPFDGAGSTVMLADLTEAVGVKSKILLVN